MGPTDVALLQGLGQAGAVGLVAWFLLVRVEVRLRAIEDLLTRLVDHADGFDGARPHGSGRRAQ